MTVDEYIQGLGLWPVEFALDELDFVSDEAVMKRLRLRSWLLERGLTENADYAVFHRQQSPDHNPTAEIFGFEEQATAALFRLLFSE